MVISSKKVGKKVSADVDKALANIDASTPKPDMKDDTIAKATAPKKAQTFAEAFREGRKAAMSGGPKTFTWNGKSYGTQLASEVKKPTPKPTTTVKKTEAPKAEAPAPGSRANPFKASTAEDITVTAKKAPAIARAKDTSERFAATQRRVPGESVLNRVLRQNREMAGYKKGGSIDGCAIRGKTRAMRKK